MEKTTPSSRRFGALGIALTDRYRYNPYVRSTVNIIVLQTFLAVLVLLAFGAALEYQQDGTIEAISRAITAALQQGATTIPPLEESLNQVQDVALTYAFLGIVALTLFFGYLTARFALKPTRDSLQFQKRFIGNMAHEIRTPLAIIKTNTEVALMDPNLPVNARETFNTTSQELDRISETINNLLSFDAMVRPSRVSLIDLDLSSIAKDVVERHRPLADSRGITLSFRSDGTHIIQGNVTGLDQVFTNLTKNAINYTPKDSGGQVTVSLEGNDRKVTATVTDTGIGISKQDLAHIFQPFYRADTSRARGVSGGTSGLGLAIVNEIVKAHRGKTSVKSAVDKGTTVEITFPKTTEGPVLELPDEDVELEEVRLS